MIPSAQFTKAGNSKRSYFVKSTVTSFMAQEQEKRKKEHEERLLFFVSLVSVTIF